MNNNYLIKIKASSKEAEADHQREAEEDHQPEVPDPLGWRYSSNII